MPKPRGSSTEFKGYYLPQEFPVLLLTGEHWHISDVPAPQHHFHNCLEVGICHEQTGFMEIHRQKLPFSAGDITLIPKNIPHTTYSSKGESSFWSYLYFDPIGLFGKLLPRNIKSFELSLDRIEPFQYILTPEAYPGLNSLLNLVIRELTEKKLGYEPLVRALLLNFYIQILRIETKEQEGDFFAESSTLKNPAPDQGSFSIAPALDYLDANYMQDADIKTLAKLCHLSSTHFRRLFTQTMDTPPGKYINAIRISKACGLLRGTDQSILDISESVGFHSVSSFNRCFSRIMHTTPREYRKQPRL